MHRALYRKWRPARFDDVIGQDAIISALQGQIGNEKIGHAYIFTGTRGTGKTTCAKLFAKAVNCEDSHNGEPCGACEVCVGLENGSILDVMEIDAASNNGVDDVRELREETAYRPSRCKYRVYIIDEVHMLSTSAFNALLKILEEPPSHVIFILATTEIHKVPATILSRCQRFDFMRIPAEAIRRRLEYIAREEDIDLSPGAADLIARLADGAMRDANSILDTCAGLGGPVDEALVRRMTGVADKDYLFAISDAVAEKNRTGALELLAGLHQNSLDARRLAEELVFHYRNLILALARPDGSLLETVSAEDRERYGQTAPAVGEDAAIRAVQRLAAAIDRMSRSPDPRIELELALFDLCETEAPAQARPQTQAQPRPASPVPSAPQAVAAPAAPPVAPAPRPVAPTPPEEVPFAVEAPPEPPPAPDEGPREEPPIQDVAAQELPPPAAQAPVQLAETPPAPVQPAAPPAPGGIAAFDPWQQVLEKMAGTDRLLYSYMKGSRAYTNGTHVLIDGGDMFLTFMRENDTANDRIKNAIAEVTGRRYGIGPYKAQQAAQTQKSAEDTLREWEQKGVEVEYK